MITLSILNPLALKFAPDWFVTNKLIEKLDNAMFSNDHIILGDIDSDIATFFSNDIDLNRINLMNASHDYDSNIKFCNIAHFFIGSKQIQKNLYLETFFAHFELSTKRNHVNFYQFEYIIKSQHLFTRIILKNTRTYVNF